ncbi:PREDICTED: ciliogenesis-associated TTC17-interacting protein-like, partial [Polistes canadensis]|uniref:ciliogenesis-associated TTC17-interacting protein-like n=1 Tax=Polistes canadensis TaxID=91411 RepID=UPI000718E908
MADSFNQSSDLLKWIPKFHIALVIYILLDHSKLAVLCFKETLLICLKDKIITQTESIGNCSISIETIGPLKYDFLINTKFCMNIDDYYCGSKVICSATNQFNCLEEKRTEYVYYKNSLNEKTLFMGIQGDSYYIKTTQTYQCNRVKNYKNLIYSQNIKLLSEGTNLLLMRYLSIINYNGILTFGNITIDGNIATCQYKCIPAEYMKIYKNHVKAYTIERIIENENGSVENMKTYLSPKGKILEHNWSSTSYVLKSESLESEKQMNRKLRIAIRNDYWMEDMEMFSKYLDEKRNEVTKFIEYLTDHVEVKHLIADYTQTLLIVKPLHVVDFTIQYFKAFSICPEIQDFISTDEISKIAI